MPPRPILRDRLTLLDDKEDVKEENKDKNLGDNQNAIYP